MLALAALKVSAVALCHGVWMGFGVGLAGFLSVRVVTEKTKFAMPECAIGVLLSLREGPIIRATKPSNS